MLKVLKEKNEGTGFFFWGLVILCFLFLFLNGYSEVPRKFFLNITSGGQMGISAVTKSLSRMKTGITELITLKEKYGTLKKRLRRYETVRQQLTLLQQENEQLRKQLGYKSRIPFQSISTRIISYDIRAPYSSLTLNKGSADGIKTNNIAVVLIGENFGLIGRIIDSSLISSVILPVTSTKSFISARLEKTKYKGLIRGTEQHNKLHLLYIPKSAISEITQGEAVITTGENSHYPPGLRIGYVESISSKNYENSLQIEVRPIVDLTKLEEIFILTQNPSPPPRESPDSPEENNARS